MHLKSVDGCSNMELVRLKGENRSKKNVWNRKWVCLD